jgi:phosphoglycolate phosphatase
MTGRRFPVQTTLAEKDLSRRFSVPYPPIPVSLSRMQQALIFDLDGTLVESLPGIAASLNRALALHGLPGHGHDSVRGFIGDGAKMLVTRAMAPGEAALHLESALRSFGEDYAVSWDQGTIPYPGIRELLSDLKSRGIPLTVLSNKPHAFTVEIVEKLFPKSTFAAVLGNREGLPHKPDPAGALEIADILGITPENCILIGDSTMDLDTAKNAGMKSIAVTWGYHDKQRLLAADEIADDVAGLGAILRAHFPT